VRGFLIEPPRCDGLLAFPTGALVEGHIISVQKVGMGFRHETAKLKISFDRIVQDGVPLDMRAQVMEVDNAREKVKGGVINGVRSTSTPEDRFSSRLQYITMWHPASYWTMAVYKATFPVFPEPELYFPAGTDLLLALAAPMPLPTATRHASENGEFDASLMESLDREADSFPERTSNRKGENADVVNLAFLGSREQLEDAFKAAGWLSSDVSSHRTRFREVGDYLFSRNYPRGLMSPQFLDGHAPDVRLEKGLDSIARRDHLRIWSNSETWQGQPVWLSASTREIGAKLSVRRKEFIHKVEPNIDGERERIVRDLTLAGCVNAVHNAPRPLMPHAVENPAVGELRTDGALAVVQLKNCETPFFGRDDEANLSLAALPSRPQSRIVCYLPGYVA
jgi:hypothetical protein